MVDDPNKNPNQPNTAAEATSRTQNKANADFDRVKSEADNQLHAAEHEAKNQYNKAREYIGNEAENAKGQARSFATDQKNYAAEQLGSVADAVNRVADDIKGDQPTMSRYAADLANGVRNVADATRDSSIDELTHRAERFGRQNPAAFLGAAALLGFAASRFVTASSHRQRTVETPAVPANPRNTNTY
ncbi:nutrient deprivation-induced protein [Devosia pacifica]|uniref:Nutrient deprivation-induced protein n=1 Tax=Devosia pacifica TaxID=1335967 RepID=A0A918SFH1_9HYPH|nr:hypothetical protein [Devosia pacifica]GHA36036.1 nutrient deprivation-induced protein [Devosia pacifica]